MSRFIWLVFMPFLSQCLLAQNNPEAVYKIRSTDFDIRLEGRTPRITEHCETEKIFYSNFNKHGHESVYYSDLYPLQDIEAETLPPDGHSRKTKVSTYETKDLVESGIFYGGRKKKEFVYPNLEAESIGRLEYSRSIKDPRLILPFYFESNIPVKLAKVSVTFPETMNIRYVLFGQHKDDVKVEERLIGKRKQLTLTLTDADAFESQKKAPPYRYYETHVILLIESYEVNHERIPVLNNVSDLFHWNNSLLEEAPNTGKNALLDKTIDEIAPREADTKEKARNIYRWVQKHIKYIAFEDGMAGFVPREPSDVFQKRYGDCKDMANLLTYMLNHAGVKAYQTWIGTRDIPYTYEKVPSPASSNHMICSVAMDSAFLFLDATDSYAAFGKPSSFIQGKEALIRTGKTDYKIVPVPILAPQENQRIDSIYVSIERGGIRGTVMSKLSGYQKSDFKIQKLKAEMDPKIELVRDFFKVGENNISITNVAMKGLDDPSSMLIVSFDFYQPDYYKSVSDKLYLNLNLERSMPGDIVDVSKRTQMIESSYRFIHQVKTYFKLPPGYAIQSVPKNVGVQGSFYQATTSYLTDPSVLMYERTLSSNYLYLDKPQFGEWNNFIQTMTDINRQSMVLVKPQ